MNANATAWTPSVASASAEAAVIDWLALQRPAEQLGGLVRYLPGDNEGGASEAAAEATASLSSSLGRLLSLPDTQFWAHGAWPATLRDAPLTCSSLSPQCCTTQQWCTAWTPTCASAAARTTRRRALPRAARRMTRCLGAC